MIFVIMGKSATGKDTIFYKLLDDETLGLKKLVPYTTRPLRKGERDRREYNFVDVVEMDRLKSAGKIIEHRQYETVRGIWHYFTVDDIDDVRSKNTRYAVIATLEAYIKLREYYGYEYIIPIYIEIDDFERLRRAARREKRQKNPSCEEVCRRFIADERDFDPVKLATAGVTKSFINDDIDMCVSRITSTIKNC